METLAEFSPKGISDLSHICSSFPSQKRTRCLVLTFSLNNIWCDDPDFLSIVKECWRKEVSGCYMSQLITLLKDMKVRLKPPDSHKYRKLQDQMKQTYDSPTYQLELQNQPNNVSSKKKNALRIIWNSEVSTFTSEAKKTKNDWVCEGDENNYFHVQAQKARKENNLWVLLPIITYWEGPIVQQLMDFCTDFSGTKWQLVLILPSQRLVVTTY